MVRILERAGFVISRTRGSHFIMTRHLVIVTVPCHGFKAIPRGTQRSIIRDAGLSKDEFERLRLS